MNFASCDKLLLSCHSWLEFTDQLKGLPTTTDQGDVFERLVQIYMLTDPEYVTQFEQVWHATSSKGELPSDVRLYLNLPLDDEGIDERDSLWAVNYAPPSAFVLEGQLYATAGGDLTVYVHVPSRRVVAYWLGE